VRNDQHWLFLQAWKHIPWHTAAALAVSISVEPAENVAVNPPTLCRSPQMPDAAPIKETLLHE
jgi:hypothetical protein